MKTYGVDKFSFQILCPVIPEYLTQVEQELIDMLKPTYNNYNAKGWDVEKYKENKKEYNIKYSKTEKYKDYMKYYMKDYYNQPCVYNGETLTLCALRERLKKLGVPHPTTEARKYLIK